ncbi:MAG TPA: GDP-L-fucose synthase [Dongiaceae bacterium]
MATPYSLSGRRIWVAGHRGMVGSAIVRRLARESCEVLTAGREALDLTRQAQTEEWMAAARPQAIFLAAGRVGGIHANDTYPAQFIYENLAIATNVIHAAHRVGVEKLLFLGSSCIYPREAPQPMAESALLTGPLEPTNEWYAVAKIAGIKLCQAYRRQHGCDFISAMPTNLYGPGDNFHPQNSHVPAALLRRFHEAKLGHAETVTVWGTGRPLREFMYVEDAADACVHLMKHYTGDAQVNVGTGSDISIAEFAERVRATVGFEGRITFDTSRPDGTPRKVMDVSTLKSQGWIAPTSLEAGLKLYYQWFLDNAAALRR